MFCLSYSNIRVLVSSLFYNNNIINNQLNLIYYRGVSDNDGLIYKYIYLFYFVGVLS